MVGGGSRKGNVLIEEVLLVDATLGIHIVFVVFALDKYQRIGILPGFRICFVSQPLIAHFGNPLDDELGGKY